MATRPIENGNVGQPTAKRLRGTLPGAALTQPSATAAVAAPALAPQLMPPVPGVTERRVLRLRGLPWQATEVQIKEWFAATGANCNHVHIALNGHGRPNGMAFVEFGTAVDAAKGQQKHRQEMGSRYIEIFESSVAEMNASQGIISPMAPQLVVPGLTVAPGTTSTKASNYQGVVRMRGLPYSSTKQDIVYFFNESRIAQDGIYMVTALDGRATGESYVEFETEEDCNKAMNKHRQKIGSRYIELFRSSKAELMNIKSHNRAAGGGKVGTMIMDHTLCCHKLRGLPYDARAEDIRKFYASLPVGKQARIVDDGIAISFSDTGRPTGMAFVEFASVEDANSAMAKDREKIGSRYIELFVVSRQEMLGSLGFGGGARGPPHGGNGGRGYGNQGGWNQGHQGYGHPGQHRPHGGYHQQMGGRAHMGAGGYGPPGAGGQDVYGRGGRGGRGGMGVGAHPSAGGRFGAQAGAPSYGSPEAPPGSAHSQYGGAAHAPTAYGAPQVYDNGGAYNAQAAAASYGAPAATVYDAGYGAQAAPTTAYAPEAGYGNPAGGYGGGAGGYGQPAPAYGQAAGASYGQQAPAATPPPGASVRMRGLPFRATNAEIESFFQGFQLMQDGIEIIAGADGRATGEGLAHFVSAEHARAAVDAKNRQMLGTRYIELFLQ